MYVGTGRDAECVVSYGRIGNVYAINLVVTRPTSGAIKAAAVLFELPAHGVPLQRDETTNKKG